MRGTLTDGNSSRCPTCRLRTSGCVCEALTNVSANVTHIAVIRHFLETKKVSNTGRFAATALSRCSLHTFGGPSERLDESFLDTPGTWLVFPEGTPALVPPSPPPKQLVFLDGTWHQARRMRQRIAGLRGLPLLCLPAPTVARQRMRRPPTQGAMSTLEAIASALRVLGETRTADELDEVHSKIVAAAQIPGRRRLNFG